MARLGKWAGLANEVRTRWRHQGGPPSFSDPPTITALRIDQEFVGESRGGRALDRVVGSVSIRQALQGSWGSGPKRGRGRTVRSWSDRDEIAKIVTRLRTLAAGPRRAEQLRQV